MSKKDWEPDIKSGINKAKNIKRHKPQSISEEEQWENVGESANNAKKRGGIVGWLILLGILFLAYLFLTGQINLDSFK